jgi:hypothetical protein
MALTVRRVNPALSIAIAVGHNKMCAQNVGASFHADLPSLTTTDQNISISSSALQVTATNSVDLTTGIALATNIIGVMKVHLADGVAADPYACGAHKIADSVDLALIPAIPTDLPSLEACLNTLKSTFNAHLTQVSPSAVHFTNDATNTVATANATDQATSNALANAIKSALNAHMGSAPATPMIKVVGP